ncbi:RICIN domain-containing protein, partial [Micromonospora sp. XM-20-01]
MVAAAGALVVGTVGAVVASPSAQAATIDTGAYYVLVNRNSGKVLDVRDTSTADGAVIQQWSR